MAAGSPDGTRRSGNEMNISFFGELLQSISERGRALIDRGRERRGDAGALREPRRTVRGAVVRPRRSLRRGARPRNPRPLRHAAIGPRIAFFEALAQRFGVDKARLDAAVDAGARRRLSDAAEVHAASEPRRQELSAASISRRTAPPRWCACASS